MSTDFAKLRAAIRADITADAPRLALAAAYEEHGDVERGEFIRFQTKRASLPWWDPDVARLELKERAILERRGEEWRGELADVDGIEWGPFERGLVGSAELYVTALGEDISSFECAAVSSIALHWPSGQERTMSRASFPDGVHELTMVGTVMGPEDVAWLVGLPGLNPLRKLGFLDSQFSRGFPRLLRSDHLEGLESLWIPLHHLGTKGLRRLFKATLPTLRELVLPCGNADQFGSGRRYRAPIDDIGAYAMAVWPGYVQIESLDLSGAALGVGGLTALVASPLARNLRKLVLRDIADGDWEMDDSLTAFQHGPGGAIEELDIGDNDLNEQAARALAAAPALRSLKALTIDKVKSKHFAVLAAAPWFEELEYLHCDATALAALLSKTARLSTLKVSADTRNAFRIASALEDATLDSLQVLDLDAAKVDGSDLSALGALPSLPLLMRITAFQERARFAKAEAATFMSSSFASLTTSVRLGAESDRLAGPGELRVGSGAYQGSLRFL